ncbi:HTH_48 domain-containing protein [Nephila pilipes]|uniref:HTH_48 domain-containing protein n=1 Tax=Nephila pilipes TaxID=299642 RepID=A0A8X6PWY6_NEPPI|nr:HTH_48 domain-containing protein [Nephila pilipes]
MSRQQQVASNLEMRAVIPFLWAKRCNYSEIYRPSHEVSDENAMSRQAIAKWCDMFENGRKHIGDAEHEGRQLTATNSEITDLMLQNKRAD